MGFHLLAYSQATGGAVVDSDMTAATDGEFSQRNNHYIFTEPYRLLAAGVFGASVTRVNIQIPTLNAVGRFNIWPINLSATIPGHPVLAWYTAAMPDLPQNEELTVKNTSTALETDNVFLWVATRDWSANLPPGKLIIPVRFTAAPTIVAAAWSAQAAITFEQSLRGGTYAIVGGTLQGANILAWRINFPKYKLYGGRKLRPGFLANNAIGDKPEHRSEINPYHLGEWGRFFTFEQPSIEVFGTAAATPACEGRLWLVFLGEQDQT